MPRLLVKSGGGFVGKDHVGVRDKRACDCDTLFLTTRQVPRQIVDPLPKDPKQSAGVPPQRLQADRRDRAPADHQYVLTGSQAFVQVMRLKDEAKPARIASG